MSWVTIDDFLDVWLKLNQRGRKFLLSKLDFSKLNRTKSAFSDSAFQSANWWIIPTVKRRWNQKITSDENLEYEDFVMLKYLGDSSRLKMLSIGSGVCSHEIKFAGYDQFEKVVCVDIAENLLKKGKEESKKRGLKNMEFLATDIYKHTFAEEFDVILFHASLHHFYDIETFISRYVKPRMKTNGVLIINEYVGSNRLQFPRFQIQAINQAIKQIPKTHRQRYKSSLYKNRFFGSGKMRMIIADPSECVDSAQILPVLRAHFQPILEKGYGGNILMNCLKDIAHNFLDDNKQTLQILSQLFQFEDEYLQDHDSDFYFGLYRNK